MAKRLTVTPQRHQTLKTKSQTAQPPAVRLINDVAVGSKEAQQHRSCTWYLFILRYVLNMHSPPRGVRGALTAPSSQAVMKHPACVRTDFGFHWLWPSKQSGPRLSAAIVSRGASWPRCPWQQHPFAGPLLLDVRWTKLRVSCWVFLFFNIPHFVTMVWCQRQRNRHSSWVA